MEGTAAKKPTVDLDYALKYVSKVKVSCMMDSL